MVNCLDDEDGTLKHPAVDSIEDVISFRLMRLNAINERIGHDWLEDIFDLSLNEWRVLALTRARAPVRAGDISEMLLMDKSQLSRLLKELIGKHLISSKTDQRDHRAVGLRLTAKGRNLYGKVMDEVMRRDEQVLEPLTVEEVHQLDAILERLISHNISLYHNLVKPHRHS